MASSPAPAPAPNPVPGPAASTGRSPAPTSSPAPAANAKASESKATTKKKKEKVTKSAAGTTKTKKATGTTRRKKPTTKAPSSASSNQALVQAAKSAQNELAKSKAQAAARRSDPLWYRIEDVVPPTTSKSDHDSLMAPSSVFPEQVQVVEAALRHNNMTRSDVTPQAMACLLEQARRYAQELIEDAQDYAAHSAGMFIAMPTNSKALPPSQGSPPEPTSVDFTLASEMRPDHPKAVTSQLPKLNLLAQQINAAPLPPIPIQCYSGILLPPQPHLLTARTFDVVSAAHVGQKMIQNPPSAPKAFKSTLSATKSKTSKGSSSSRPGYGASKGAQIPIHLRKQDSTSASPQQQPQQHDATPKPPALSKPNAPSTSVPMPSKPSAASGMLKK